VIARVCKISNSTVGEYLQRAQQAGLHWPLPDGASDDELYRKLFPENGKSAEFERVLPDWESVHKELKKKGVTLKLPWIEYHDEHPDGHRYTQFGEYYRRWAKTQSPTGRFPHPRGEVMEVDNAGLTLSIIHPETGETHQGQVFAATFPASDCVYAEIQPSLELCHWINGHVRALAFFGGHPKIFRPDNLKSGVKSPNYYEPDLNPTCQEMAEYYQVAVLPARVRAPRDKNHVENGMQDIDRWVLAPLRKETFFSEADANRAIQPLVEALNQRKTLAPAV
jgi:transposase